MARAFVFPSCFRPGGHRRIQQGRCISADGTGPPQTPFISGWARQICAPASWQPQPDSRAWSQRAAALGGELLCKGTWLLSNELQLLRPWPACPAPSRAQRCGSWPWGASGARGLLPLQQPGAWFCHPHVEASRPLLSPIAQCREGCSGSGFDRPEPTPAAPRYQLWSCIPREPPLSGTGLSPPLTLL